MRTGGRRPGTGAIFVDALTEEVLLQVVTSMTGEIMISYNLHDNSGELVAETDGLRSCPGGEEVRCGSGELLLLVPTDPEDAIQYRLYSRKGTLLTCSDGSRTQLFMGIRVDGIKPNVRATTPKPWKAKATEDTPGEAPE